MYLFGRFNWVVRLKFERYIYKLVIQARGDVSILIIFNRSLLQGVGAD